MEPVAVYGSKAFGFQFIGQIQFAHLPVKDGRLAGFTLTFLGWRILLVSGVYLSLLPANVWREMSIVSLVCSNGGLVALLAPPGECGCIVACIKGEPGYGCLSSCAGR